MTVYEYIRRRWPEHAQRIVECAIECDKAGAEYDLVRDIGSYEPQRREHLLSGLFIWSITREGHEYWRAVSEQGERVDVS